MSPFFSWENKRAVRTYFLADQTILPFIEDSSRDVDMDDDEDFQGGHGSIFKVKIHPAHHNFHHIAEAHDSDSAFAVKRLHSRSREMLSRECKGMAEGLNIIHEPPPDQSDDYAYEAALQPSHRQSHSSQSYGRHGDIKPENILWFRNGPNTNISVLEIADFGLTRFHNRRSLSNISPVGMGNSPTYRAPEFDMPDGLLSRSYDIWALGCVYLEFLTWYFMGWKGVMEFSTLREYKRNNLEADDAYFELTGAPETGNICSKVKHEVVHWMASLHQHRACSPFFHDFLDLIKDSMLVVETDGEVPVRRATAAEVRQSLVRFYNRSGSDATYLSGRNPLNIAVDTMFTQGSHNGNLMSLQGQKRSSTVTGSNPTGVSRGSSSLFRQGSRSTSFSGSCGLPSTSSSDLSHRLTSATQTTQNTNIGDTKDNNSPFACPFFRRDPNKYGKTCSRGWLQFHRLKEHLFRKHFIPRYRCSRCLSCFDNTAALEEHVRSVQPCALREPTEIEGITADQERRLRSRKRTKAEADSNEGGHDTQRWHEMYRIVFPDADALAVSPCE
ncbi:kinase-like protein [Fusarium flagelliforme]|uniref:Kinase-like protein n=1 Tax=Fusarium flagelliforme TaxID=2675880 RepID=A0A395M5G6_9HYPO|nr:kinase-like protein [Fusarium flagelliforme]